MTLISVIISNYNYEEYIGEAIQSVINQTYSDFEIIIVDDGSTDNSINIINEFKLKYPKNIRVFQKENGGQASAFNTGYGASKGEIIAFLDADDYWYSNKLETIVHYHKEYDGVQHNLLINNQKKYTFLDNFKLKQQHALTKFSFLGKIPTSGLSFRKSCLEWFFPVPEEFTICTDLYVRNMFVLKHELFSIDEPLAMYRAHENNNWFESENKSSKYIEMTLEALNIELHKLEKSKIPTDNRALLFSEYLLDTTDFEEGKVYVIYGVGVAGRVFYNHIKQYSDILCFASTTILQSTYCDLPVVSPEFLLENQSSYDQILIASEYMVDIMYHLLGIGVPKDKILYPQL